MALTVTSRALQEILRVLEEAKQNHEPKTSLEERRVQDDSLFLRIRLTIHGCGLVPELSFEIKTEPDDEVFEHRGITIRMDPVSAGHLKDTELDYGKNGLLGGLRFNHPTNFHSCGCGRAFTQPSKK